jgi:uncharacterized protein
MNKINIDNSKKPVIIFDTNFFLIPEQFKIDIFEETKSLLINNKPFFIIFDKTINELKKISSQRTKYSISAKVGLKLINDKKNEIKIINTSDNEIYVDNLIINNINYINLKDNNNIYIATQDKELKSKLKNKNIKIIVLAQKKILKLV